MIEIPTCLFSAYTKFHSDFIHILNFTSFFSAVVIFHTENNMCACVFYFWEWKEFKILTNLTFQSGSNISGPFHYPNAVHHCFSYLQRVFRFHCYFHWIQKKTVWRVCICVYMRMCVCACDCSMFYLLQCFHFVAFSRLKMWKLTPFISFYVQIWSKCFRNINFVYF